MKKKYRAVHVDSLLSSYWRVLSSDDYLVAQFCGYHSRRYARAHAKMLNALPKEDQP